eukprot:s3563_g2.t1
MERHLLPLLYILPWAYTFCTAFRIEDHLEEMGMQDLLDLRYSLLQSHFVRSRRSVDNWSENDEKTFALEEVRKAWYIHEIKERLDLGDVKEDLLSQLSSLQQQCPDAEEIQSQLSDLWEEVGRWVKADDLRLAMEREQKSIHKEEARMNLDVEGTKQKIKDLEGQSANATKVFTKDQESRLFEIVNVAQRLQELKKLISNAVHSDDVRELQEQFDPLQKAYKDLTKDLSDSQLQQAFHVVDLRKEIEAVKKDLSKEHIDNELKSRTQMAESRYNALKRQLETAKKEIDLNAMEKQIMSVWEKSLHDLPDMAELRNASQLKQAQPQPLPRL